MYIFVKVFTNTDLLREPDAFASASLASLLWALRTSKILAVSSAPTYMIERFIDHPSFNPAVGVLLGSEFKQLEVFKYWLSIVIRVPLVQTSPEQFQCLGAPLLHWVFQAQMDTMYTRARVARAPSPSFSNPACITPSACQEGWLQLWQRMAIFCLNQVKYISMKQILNLLDRSPASDICSGCIFAALSVAGSSEFLGAEEASYDVWVEIICSEFERDV